MDISVVGPAQKGYHSEITDSEIRHFYRHPEDLKGSIFYYMKITEIERLYKTRVYPMLLDSEREDDNKLKTKNS